MRSFCKLTLPLLMLIATTWLTGCTDQPFTVDVPIRVVAIHPSGQDVPRDTAVEASFSEDLVPETVSNAANFYIEDVTDPANPIKVEGTITYDQSAFKATLQPAALLAYSTPYRVTLTTGIKRLRDNGPLPIQVTGAFRTLDPPPLRLVNSNPGSNSIGVALDSVIELTFSEPVDCASLEAGVAILEVFDPHPHTGPGQRDVGGSWACTQPDSIDVDSCDGNDFCIVTFTPDTPFLYSSDVTLTLKGGTRADGAVESNRATDFGGQLPEDVAISFHVDDPPDFYVAGAQPGSQMSGVPLDSAITIQFSEPVDCDTLTGNLAVEETLDDHPRLGAAAGTTRTLSGTLVCNPAPAGDYSCGDGGPTDPCLVGFTPDAPFEWSSLVAVTLSGAAYTPGTAPATRVVESTRATSYGGNLTDDFIFSFRVQDPPPLAVAAVDPAAGAEMVQRDAPLGIVFSEPLNCDSVNDVTVAISETLDPLLGGGTAAVSGTLTCTPGDPQVSFVPDAPFGYSSVIDVTLKGGPFDAAAYPNHAIESAVATTRGGQLPADFGYDFIAQDPPPLYVTGTSPAAGSVRVALDADIEITFSEALDCSTIDATTFTVNEQTDSGASIAHTGTLSCNAGDPLVVFDPDIDFQRTSRVTVALLASIRSARGTSRGGTLGSDFVFSFSTIDPLPLLVVSTQPGGSQDNVTTDANIVVTFSEAVDRNSLDPSTFVVEDISDPQNPLPIACGVPDGTYGFGSGDALVTCDPPSDFIYDATIRVRLTTGIRAAIATSAGGNLPFDVVWSFDIIPVPPIEVTQVVPGDGAQNVPVASNVAVIFNQDILQSTLVTYADARPCAADGDCPGGVLCGNVNAGFCDPDPSNVTVWLNPGATSDVNTRVALDLLSYDSNSFTAVFDTVADLTGGLQYTFGVRGGLTGVRGRYGASIMVANFVSNFTTGINMLLAGTIPHDGDSGVQVTTEVCAVFLEDIDPTTITTSSFGLTFDDDFGTQAVPVSGFTYEGVDPFTLEPDATGTYTNNKVCLVIAPEFWDCHPDARPLLYNTSYQAMLADSITNADGSVTLVGGYAWTFTTGGPPQVLGAYGQNTVVTVDPLAGGSDLPVNCAFHVEFAAELDPATLDSTRLRVLDASGTPVGATVSASADLFEAIVTPDAILGFDADYKLVLAGGYGGVTLADGSYLDADFEAAFHTSPPTYATISPPLGENTYPTAMAPVVFSRDIYFPSLTEANIFAVDNTDGATLQGVVATNSGDPDSCILQVVPTYLSGHDVTVNVTQGVMDFRGNPLGAPAAINYPTVGNTPAVNARIPDPVAAGDVSPAAASAVLGDQLFVLSMPGVGGNLRDRMLPPTFNRYTIGFMGTGVPAGCPSEAISSSNDYVIGAAAQPDSVLIRAGNLLRSGCGYQLILRQSQFSNIYGVANGDPDLVVDYVGESVAPTLAVTDIHIDAMAGPDLPADGRADVWSRTAISATFDENVDPASVGPATFTLVCDGNPVAGNISVQGTTAFFETLLPLAGAAACSATLGAAVTDMAGNALGADVTVSFTVESVPPAVLATSPADSDVNVPVTSDITITFSEQVDPSTLQGSTVNGSGTIQLWDQAAGSEVFGCIEPGATPEEVIFSPYGDLGAASVYDLVITTGVADFGATPLVADVGASFTTQ
ncbi:MAG TPA: Ig-like domain-containing protein [Myxococcota bacterium]|nr:Ig-like domain-containing protein [Myxococcota bacterium]